MERWRKAVKNPHAYHGYMWLEAWEFKHASSAHFTLQFYKLVKKIQWLKMYRFSCLSVGLLVCNTSPRRHPDSILVRSPNTSGSFWCWGAVSVLWIPPRWLDSSPDRSGETAFGEGSFLLLLLVATQSSWPQVRVGTETTVDRCSPPEPEACIWLYHLYLAGIYQPHTLRQAPSSPEKLRFMSKQLVSTSGDWTTRPSTLDSAQHTLHSIPAVPFAVGEPTRGWAHITSAFTQLVPVG